MRVFPLYRLVLTTWLVVFMFGSSALEPTLGLLAANVLLIPTENQPLVGVAWTLHHELLFYWVFASFFVSKKLGIALVCGWTTWIAGVASGFVDRYETPLLRMATSTYNPQSLLGLAAAWGSRRCSAGLAMWAVMIGAVGFVGTLFFEAWARLDGESVSARLAYGLACAMFVMRAGREEIPAKLRIPSAATALGKASYAIYLVHLLAIGVAYKCLMKIGIGPSLGPQLFLGLLVAFAVFAGMCVSRWIK